MQTDEPPKKKKKKNKAGEGEGDGQVRNTWVTLGAHMYSLTSPHRRRKRGRKRRRTAPRSIHQVPLRRVKISRIYPPVQVFQRVWAERNL